MFQRPQHLMLRLARNYDVTFWEEPIFDAEGASGFLELRPPETAGVRVAVPHLPEGLSEADQTAALRALLDQFVESVPTDQPLVRWYYTPMMLPFSRTLRASRTVYDCMDELSAFRFAPPTLLALEEELLGLADVVFTGGKSLYESKRKRHANVHAFPSSVDVAHFAQARTRGDEPADQADLPGPKLGFFGVIDERMDLELLAAAAAARPQWTFVVLGPVVKIAETDLPRLPNLHYLGQKTYNDLPRYLSGWDVALMPFAMNEATRFISPTKTPEYLAGGCPVVSTPITDVVAGYGALSPAVQIARDVPEFIAACDAALALDKSPDAAWRGPADTFISRLSWDATAEAMRLEIQSLIPRPAKGSAGGRTPRSTAQRPSGQPAYDYLIVGAGFAGAVLAERLASQLQKRVLLIDKRSHIGGNAYDERNEHGLTQHRYGPHLFHTNSDEVFSYLSQFTRWRPYEHRVLASVRGQLTPIPINRTTLNQLYGAKLTTDEEAEAFLARLAEPVDTVRTSEDVVVSKVGRELYELFFRGYTRKQWGLDPSALDKSVTARVPTRVNTDDRYFTDRHQAMPAAGYTAMFARMLDHPRITVALDTCYEEVAKRGMHQQLIFTGPIDEFFGRRYGPLPYRSLRFEHKTLPQTWFQPVGTVNYPDEAIPYTRITEYKHVTGETSRKTTITLEYPQADGDPFYPIPKADNHALFKKYEALALARPDVTFVGRLATYRYYNMDQVVGQALATYRRIAAADADMPALATG